MRKRLIFETLHLDLEGGVGERRTTPSMNAMALEAGMRVHEHNHEHDAETPRNAVDMAAALEVAIEVGAEGNKMQDAPSVGVKVKRPSKRVAFHSDRPDLYDF
jgi:elongator complex protein 4